MNKTKCNLKSVLVTAYYWIYRCRCFLVSTASFRITYPFTSRASYFFQRRPRNWKCHVDLGVEDPMSAVLRALVAKISQATAANARAPQLRHLLFEATRQAFARDADADYLVV